MTAPRKGATAADRPTRRTPAARAATGAARTCLFRVALAGQRSVTRDIEIAATDSLAALALAITDAFGFAFDHPYGFYSGTTRSGLARLEPRYELFADMAEGESDAGSVECTSVAEAFPSLRHAMTFLFDYGDEWLFRVKLTAYGAKQAGVAYPRVIASQGDAPEQYPGMDDED